MSFHEVQFPVGISEGSRRGQTHSVGVIEVDGGQEERIARWSGARMVFDASFGIMNLETPTAGVRVVDRFMRARQGRTYGFRYKDWHDYTSASDDISAPDDEDQSIGTGTGTQTQFQLVKQYTSGPTTVTRTILKPVTGTVVVAVDGTPQTEGVNFTVNAATGIVTFTAAPGVATAITAGFEFDTPARFDIDRLDIQHDGYLAASMPGIPIIELLDETEFLEDPYPGGGTDWGAISASISLSVADGRTQWVEPSTSGLNIILPDATTLVPGEYFKIKNNGSATITVQIPGPTDLVDITVGDALEFDIYVVGGVNTWVSGQI